MYFLLLVRCALDNLSMEGVCDQEFESSDRLFYYLGKMSVEEVTGYCNLLLRRAFKVLWMNRWDHRPVLLAIDTNDMPYDGRDNDYVHYTIKKRGLKINKVKVLRFITMSIVSKKFKLTLAVHAVRKKDKLETVMEELLKEIPPELRVRAVLMDKGFYYTDIFKTMDKYRLKYVVPIKRYDEMGFWYHLAEIINVWRFRYTMNKNKRGKEPYTFNVYLQDEGIEDYIGYASNLDMAIRDFETLTEAYRYRWNIENGFKESKLYRIKTNTRNHAYRVLVYAFSHLMMNLHVIARILNKTSITITQMIIIFKILLTFKHGTKRMTKRITITY